MRLETSLNNYKSDSEAPLILGIGNFDGIHKGHQALLGHVVEQARLKKGIPAVLTFQKHPQHILHPQEKPPLLMSNEHKLLLLKEMGIELCFWLPFTEEFSKIDPHAFVEEWLVKQLNVRDVCMGYNARFGYKRQGDVSLMRELAEKHGFEFERISPIEVNGETVSSSRIRGLVSAGELKLVEACLGREFSVLGKVVRGAGRGKGLGFPTANIETVSDVLPPTGVYPIQARLYDEPLIISENAFEASAKPRIYQGVVNYGFRPTFDEQEDRLSLEAHLFDFADEDLEGKNMEIIFFPRLRQEQAFDGPEALVEQIRRDVEHARTFFDQIQGKKGSKSPE